MLFLLNNVIVGNYFCYDYPAYLEVQIEDEYDVSAKKYGLLYSSYGIPNLVLPFFVGVLYDMYGTMLCMTLFTTFVMMGQALIALGGFTMNFNMLLIGRFIYGIGCENQIYTIIIVEWFYHFELSLGMGLSEVLPLAASTAAGLVIPRVYDLYDEPDQCFGYTFGVGFLVTTYSFIAMILLACLDYKMNKHDKKLLKKC